MTAVRAVVFDFDGVLADTERLHLRGFQEVLAPCGLPLDEATYYADYLGYDDRGLVVQLARDRGVTLDAGTLAGILEAKARRFAALLGAGAALFPAAPSCVARLGARFPLAIASGALRHEIVTILDGAGLTPAFGAIIGADDVAASKPAPDSYLEATRRLGVAPTSAVAIEDSTWGLDAARTAGLRTIAITTSYPATALQRADVVISSLDEVTEALVERLLNR
ncbi:MAG TPA: HAD family phosphatase [Vicinamibacterales bacterium]|nr:HAD family phosphatase [Vicinamibacterales bacterium]